MIDLEQIQARYDLATKRHNLYVVGELLASAKDVPSLVAELHAAREVITMAREGFPRIWSGALRVRANAALAAYDKVTGGK